ncbi:11897_t:CDS:2, partial [Diversispora eburnea]
ISTVSTLIQYYILIPSYIREPYLVHLLRSEEFKDKSTIIFCGRCKTAELLRVILVELDIRCTSLHSSMSQRERLNSLGKFKAEIVKILIATDVGSRGLDIPTVQTVINYDIPRDPTDYIHRVGRTARAGRGGISLSIVTESDIELVQNIETRINKKMDQWKINENKILASLNEISTAKRVAKIHLHDTNFGAKKEINEKKRKILETDLNNDNNSSSKSNNNNIIDDGKIYNDDNLRTVERKNNNNKKKNKKNSNINNNNNNYNNINNKKIKNKEKK